MGKPRESRAVGAVLPRDAVFSPSGTIVRLRRGNKREALLALQSAASQPFACDDLTAMHLAVVAAIERGDLEVI